MNWVYVVANNSESLGVSTEAVVITPTEALVFSESFGLSAVATPTHSTESSGVAPAHSIESFGVATEATPTQSTVSTGSSVSKGKEVMEPLATDVVNVRLAQRFGVSAIGESVCRDFGRHGIFHGKITAYHFNKAQNQGLYTITYTDNDREDLDTEEYNYAYSLWLQEEGWEAEEDDGGYEVPFHYTLPMLINFDLALSFSYFQPKRYRKKPRLLLNEMRKDPKPKKKVARL